MKKILVSLAALAMIATATTALAGESRGKVKMIDPATKTLTLEDGTKYQVSDLLAVEGLKPGQSVTVSYETKDGLKQAKKVTIAK